MQCGILTDFFPSRAGRATSVPLLADLDDGAATLQPASGAGGNAESKEELLSLIKAILPASPETEGEETSVQISEAWSTNKAFTFLPAFVVASAKFSIN